MANRSVLVARPTDIITASATLSLTAGTAAAAFPLANLKDTFAHVVFKATGTSCTIRSHWASPVTLQGVMLANHNLAGATVTVTNPAGFSRALVIPANTADGLCLDPWDDYRGLNNTTDDDWDIAISGASANVAVGELLWVQTWRELWLDLGSGRYAEEHPAKVHGTDAHPVAHVYGMGTRTRRFGGTTADEVTVTELRTLARGTSGPRKHCVVIPDDGVNDALYGRLTLRERDEAETGPRGSGFRSAAFEVIESLRGLAL